MRRLALLQAALERHPGHPALEYENAVVLESAGKVHESVAALDRLIAERPDDPTLLNALGYTLADHKLQTAARREAHPARACLDTGQSGGPR